MLTLVQTKVSIINCTITDLNGEVVYEVTTPTVIFNNVNVTTISRGGKVVATIEWHKFGPSQMTFEGRTGTLKELFPKPRTLSKSRIYTTTSGVSFKWKHSGKMHCVLSDSRETIATYYRIPYTFFKNENSTLDINDGSEDLMDALVVTWIIMEKIDKDRRDS